jgi:hypothetical protein
VPETQSADEEDEDDQAHGRFVVLDSQGDPDLKKYQNEVVLWHVAPPTLVRVQRGSASVVQRSRLHMTQVAERDGVAALIVLKIEGCPRTVGTTCNDCKIILGRQDTCGLVDAVNAMGVIPLACETEYMLHSGLFVHVQLRVFY